MEKYFYPYRLEVVSRARNILSERYKSLRDSAEGLLIMKMVIGTKCSGLTLKVNSGNKHTDEEILAEAEGLLPQLTCSYAIERAQMRRKIQEQLELSSV